MSVLSRALLGIVILWVAVIIATTVILKGTPYLGPMVPVLGGGAAGTLVILHRSLRRAARDS